MVIVRIDPVGLGQRLEGVEGQLTAEDRVDGEEVGGDGQRDHGKGEGKELEDDGSIKRLEVISNISHQERETNEGTAGLMFDLGPDLVSSWSR